MQLLKIINLNDYNSDYYTYNYKENNLHDEEIIGIIDYIFMNKKLDVKRWIDKPKVNWSKEHNDLSDHYPLNCLIKF